MLGNFQLNFPLGQFLHQLFCQVAQRVAAHGFGFFDGLLEMENLGLLHRVHLLLHFAHTAA